MATAVPNGNIDRVENRNGLWVVVFEDGFEADFQNLQDAFNAYGKEVVEAFFGERAS